MQKNVAEHLNFDKGVIMYCVSELHKEETADLTNKLYSNGTEW